MIRARFEVRKAMPTQAQIETALDKAVSGCAQEILAKFKEDVLSGSLGLPAKISGRGVPLVRTSRYIRSWKAASKGRTFSMSPTGHHGGGLSNEALGLLLEYGWSGVAPRPHIRILIRRILKEGGKNVGRRLVYELRRSS